VASGVSAMEGNYRLAPAYKRRITSNCDMAQVLLYQESESARHLSASEKERIMLYYALVFLVVALIAGVLGVSGVAGIAMNIAYVLFVVAIVLFLVHLLSGRRTLVP
jgi:uncharacterized membrane protein YtjA (UPF0391 family)